MLSDPSQSLILSRHFSKLDSLEEKFCWVRDQFSTIRIPWSEEYEILNICRENVLEDSFRETQRLSDRDMRKELHIQFSGEMCMDAGGIMKEWLNILIKELFAEQLQLFQRAKTEEVGYIISSSSNCQSELYYFTGRVLAKAVFENIPVASPLCKSLFKHLLGHAVTFEDIQYQDSDLYKSLQYIATNSIEDMFIGFFALEKENVLFELVENGSELCITEENKSAYLDLRYKFETSKSMEPGLTHLKNGFHSVIPHRMIAELTPGELELLLCGKGFLDLEEWMANTEYKGDFSSSHRVVKWFWAVLREFTQEELSQLLVFVTGASKVPVEGFAQLKTLRGEPAHFTLQSVEHYRKVLPRAHTCFNRLDLPMYPSKSEVKEVLRLVINNHTLGFGLE